MNNIRRHKNMLPYFILTPNNYVNSTSCKKLKRLQFNINLINRIKNEVNPNKKFFSIDTESFIQEILTEFGWSVFNNNGTVIKEQHFIIDETYDLRNNDYIPENKKKYLFGNSERKPFHEIIKILQNEIDNVDFIIGQGIHNDIKYLHDSGIDFTNFTFIDGDSFDPNGKAIIEISDLFSAYSLSSPKSLEYGLNYFKIKYKNLHNAGNDAHYTMIYFLNIINNYDFDSPRYQRLLELNVPSHVSPFKYNRYQIFTNKNNYIDGINSDNTSLNQLIDFNINDKNKIDNSSIENRNFMNNNAVLKTNNIDQETNTNIDQKTNTNAVLKTNNIDQKTNTNAVLKTNNIDQGTNTNVDLKTNTNVDLKTNTNVDQKRNINVDLKTNNKFYNYNNNQINDNILKSNYNSLNKSHSEINLITINLKINFNYPIFFFFLIIYSMILMILMIILNKHI